MLGLIKTAGERFGQTIVMITHNDEIAQMAGRIIRIEDGKICKERLLFTAVHSNKESEIHKGNEKINSEGEKIHKEGDINVKS